jgi:hypothetical protein
MEERELQEPGGNRFKALQYICVVASSSQCGMNCLWRLTPESGIGALVCKVALLKCFRRINKHITHVFYLHVR